MSLTPSARIHAVRHDLTRAIDQLRLPVEAGVRAIVARARDDLDAIASELPAGPAGPAAVTAAEARAAAATALAAALQREADLGFWRRTPVRFLVRAASPSIAGRLLDELAALPPAIRRALLANE